MEVLGALWSDPASWESPFFVLVVDRQVETPGPPPMAALDPAELNPICPAAVSTGR